MFLDVMLMCGCERTEKEREEERRGGKKEVVHGVRNKALGEVLFSD